jgi:hypothetical protein
VRSEIFDWLTTSEYHWSGRMDEPEFLARLYDLTSLPSTDYRFGDAAGDIRQHTVLNPQDWDKGWVFGDERFDLRGGSDQNFLNFLSATVHPVTRRQPEHTRVLIDTYNEALRPVGFEIAQSVSRLGETPIFEARETTAHHTPAESRIVERPDLADRTVLKRHLVLIDSHLDADPPSAIDSSKNLLETLFKIILTERGATFNERDELPGLFKAVALELDIDADSVAGNPRGSDAIRKMLRTLTTTVQAVAEARNSMGDGHGTAEVSAAQPRHARLAFNATVTVAEFVADTWQAQTK